ncbi:carbonic anhydrase 6-like [Dreissena polymorpha]|uniref:carbonic anhydrase 6-like n=1 Tax=Dreissena polymorpha TaxID=45954 RepID=UPI0022656128|nr:carbonic anhydrase 6-like [Dreissena polymorpha]
MTETGMTRLSCSALAQSPVNIETSRLRVLLKKDSCPRIFYSNNMIRGSFINNGHTAQFRINRGEIEASNLPNRPGRYLAHDFHVHYGGSLLSQAIHFVLFNSKYGTLENAENKPDGVAVLAFFVTRVPENSFEGMKARGFSQIWLTALPRIRAINSTVNARINLKTFFDRKCEFFTLPVCAWSELQALESTGDFDARYGNYRVSQPLNDRIVEANFLPLGNTPNRRRRKLSHTLEGEGDKGNSLNRPSRWWNGPSKRLFPFH